MTHNDLSWVRLAASIVEKTPEEIFEKMTKIDD
jgi:hypothetical protein